MFYRFRFSVQSRSTQRWVKLVVEELESRTVLSGTSAFVQPGVTDLPYGTIALPQNFNPSQILQANADPLTAVANGNAGAVDETGFIRTSAITDSFGNSLLPDIAGGFNTLLEPSFSSSILAAPDAKPTQDAEWGNEFALDVECPHTLTPGESYFLVEALPQSLIEYLPAVVYSPSPGPGEGSVWTSDSPGADVSGALLDSTLGAIGFAPTTPSAGNQSATVFSGLDSGDWQGMVESTWGYRPGQSISSELARSVHYAKADVTAGFSGSDMFTDVLDLSADDVM